MYTYVKHTNSYIYIYLLRYVRLFLYLCVYLELARFPGGCGECGTCDGKRFARQLQAGY